MTYTTTDYGSWYNHAGAPTVESYVADACDGGDAEWAEQMEKTGAFDRIADDFRTAVNEALPDRVALCGDEFIGPAYDEDCTWDGDLDIAEIINDVDFWAIVEKHDVDNATYEIDAKTEAQAEQVAAAVREAITDIGEITVHGAVVRFDAEVYGQLLAAYDEDPEDRAAEYIYAHQLHSGRNYYNIAAYEPGN